MNKIIEQILRVFEAYMMPHSAISQYAIVGKDILMEKIRWHVVRKLPIKFVMLGFPFKSINTRDKVIGQVPDRAEEATFRNFDVFNDTIKIEYSPGVEIHMVSDGYVFNDLYPIEDRVVTTYLEMSKDLSGDCINWYDISNFYNKGSLSQKRNKLIQQFGISEEKLEAEILLNPDVNSIYRGIKIFMEEETAIKEFPSHKAHTREARRMARAVMFRNEAYSALVRREFSDMIRISMHDSTNNGSKYSFQLIPGCTKHSAWHSALVVKKNGTFRTMHRIDAINAGHQLVNKDNRPYYFQEV